MKANDIKCLDYSMSDDKLRLVLSEATVDEIAGMRSETVTIGTDAGDTVEIFAGYVLSSVTVDVKTGLLVATLCRNTDDTTAAALDELSKQLAVAKQNQAQSDDAAIAVYEALEKMKVENAQRDDALLAVYEKIGG